MHYKMIQLLRNRKKFVTRLIFVLAILSLFSLGKTYYHLMMEATEEAAKGLGWAIHALTTGEKIPEVPKMVYKDDYVRKYKKPNDVIIYLQTLGGIRSGDAVQKDRIKVGRAEIIGVDYEQYNPYVVLLVFNDDNFKLSEKARIYIRTKKFSDKKFFEIVQE